MSKGPPDVRARSWRDESIDERKFLVHVGVDVVDVAR